MDVDFERKGRDIRKDLTVMHRLNRFVLLCSLDRCNRHPRGSASQPASRLNFTPDVFTTHNTPRPLTACFSFRTIVHGPAAAARVPTAPSSRLHPPASIRKRYDSSEGQQNHRLINRVWTTSSTVFRTTCARNASNLPALSALEFVATEVVKVWMWTYPTLSASTGVFPRGEDAE